MEIKLDYNSLYFAFVVLVPGIIILSTNSYFSKNSVSITSELIWRYVPVSLIYNAIVLPISAKYLYQGGNFSLCYWYSFVVLIPLVVGILSGLLENSEHVYKFLNFFHIRVVHRVGTAWDWKFSTIQGNYVIVTLDDGTRFSGYVGNDSFISSNAEKRDIYIEQIYKERASGWIPLPQKTGVLIGQNRIKSVEILENAP